MARTTMRACTRGNSYYPTPEARQQEGRNRREGRSIRDYVDDEEDEEDQVARSIRILSQSELFDDIELEEQEEQEEEEEEEEEESNEQERETETGVTIEDHDVLDCYICYQPLRAPLFQCDLGHVSCPTCFAKLSNKCPICSGTIGNTRSFSLEKVIEVCRTFCPNKSLGCPARIPYYQKNEHKNSCPFFRCFCPEECCLFSHCPKVLLRHVRNHHDWPTLVFEYGTVFYVPISDSFRFKVLVDKDDMMFLLLLDKISQGMKALSLVCVRAPNLRELDFSYKLAIDGDTTDASSSSSGAKKRGRKLKFSGPVMNSALEERSCDGQALLLAGDSWARKEFRVSVCVLKCAVQVI